ncbi:WG repeat-containing protein [Psychrobacter cryohalolentis]|uniref:KWG Leptospira n=1 Tax=Psychrobacter cryohalolentis (strain ATCC BAA-1226 / DSM 17306 / VKM B-2378 / K5) TaxID=335284 RepID=Q1QBH4_PSYCK|nr:KWG Leptospira [Psychrobacter cryohalolentis K5]ASE25187.1 WG repeat-containing protein [Psychrobacter cryohalolentis]
MLQRTLSKRSLLLTTSENQSALIKCCALTIGMLTTALFVIPSAQAASCKIPKSYYKNVSCTASSGYFLAVKDFGAPVALIDKQGKSLVDLTRYQKVDADKISAGLLPVMRNSHVGYLNMQGREVIPVMYDVLNDGQGWARPVSEGRIVVKQGGHYGVIDTANRTIVPFSAAISDIDDYRGGMARVRKNKAISWLDKEGNIKNANTQSTNTQNAGVKKDSSKSNDGKSAKNSRVNDRTAASKSEVKPSARANSTQKNSASIPINRFTTLQPRQQDGRWGFVDDNNVTMITYSFDEVRPFSEGLAGVRIDAEWGFINLGGELVIPFNFKDFDGSNNFNDSNNKSLSLDSRYKDKPSFVFVADKAWIGRLENGTKMCIDKEGAAVACD